VFVAISQFNFGAAMGMAKVANELIGTLAPRWRRAVFRPQANPHCQHLYPSNGWWRGQRHALRCCLPPWSNGLLWKSSGVPPSQVAN